MATLLLITSTFLQERHEIWVLKGCKKSRNDIKILQKNIFFVLGINYNVKLGITGVGDIVWLPIYNKLGDIMGDSAHSPTFPSLHLRHSSFYNPSVALPTSQLILQPFRCFTNITAHSTTLLSFLLRHRLFTYVTWRATHARYSSYREYI